VSEKTQEEKRHRPPHLPHSVHCSPDSNLGLDWFKVFVEQHAHARMHRHGQPEQQVMVLAKQRVLEVDGCVGDNQ
jgi:hypothetical protein